MTEPFASTQDLKRMWAGYTDVMESRAETLLSSVSAAIASLCDYKSIDSEVLRLVACNCVSRILQSSDNLGVQSTSWGASPYSGSITFSNPSGDVYLTAFEKSLLGIGEGYAAFVMPDVG